MQSDPVADLAHLFDITPSESRVLQFLVTGMSYRHIGEELKITERTIQFHATNIFHKMDVRTRDHFDMWLRGRGWTVQRAQVSNAAEDHIRLLKRAIRRWAAAHDPGNDRCPADRELRELAISE